MLTERLLINKEFPEPEIINAAVKRLYRGEIVAFPTETVYGLGAIAMNPQAVGAIFAAKDRPPANPLIVHIGDMAQAYPLVREWPSGAEKLARTFWPGPLTLVLPAAEQVPDVVRGSGSGVGIRMPDHPVALALINASAPLAAPSANRSGRPSPRTADEVWDDLNGRIPLLLDAGATPSGLESTVLDLQNELPRIIRPGGISRQQIEQCLGQEIIYNGYEDPAKALPHYQIAAQILAITSIELPEVLQQLAGKKIALVANNKLNVKIAGSVVIWSMQQAGELFTLLRQTEKENYDALVLIKDAGLPWDAAMEHRVQAAILSSGLNNRVG